MLQQEQEQQLLLLQSAAPAVDDPTPADQLDAVCQQHPPPIDLFLSWPDGAALSAVGPSPAAQSENQPDRPVPVATRAVVLLHGTELPDAGSRHGHSPQQQQGQEQTPEQTPQQQEQEQQQQAQVAAELNAPPHAPLLLELEAVADEFAQRGYLAVIVVPPVQALQSQEHELPASPHEGAENDEGEGGESGEMPEDDDDDEDETSASDDQHRRRRRKSNAKRDKGAYTLGDHDDTDDDNGNHRYSHDAHGHRLHTLTQSQPQVRRHVRPRPQPRPRIDGPVEQTVRYVRQTLGVSRVAGLAYGAAVKNLARLLTPPTSLSSSAPDPTPLLNAGVAVCPGPTAAELIAADWAAVARPLAVFDAEVADTINNTAATTTTAAGGLRRAGVPYQVCAFGGLAMSQGQEHAAAEEKGKGKETAKGGGDSKAETAMTTDDDVTVGVGAIAREQAFYQAVVWFRRFL